MKYSNLPIIVRFTVGLLGGVTFALVIAFLLSSCGSYEPGSSDRTVDCIDGCNSEKDSLKGDKGDKGSTGPRGNSGSPGPGGESCTVQQFENGAIISCESSSAIIYSGKDGSDGSNGTNGLDAEPGNYSFSEVIDPCGAEAAFDEIIFRTESGELVAHFAKGKKQFLTFIGPGNYKTTDGTNCRFTVDQDNQVSW